jgi:putative N-acetylmannosamine-6-phosphate epimerase
MLRYAEDRSPTSVYTSWTGINKGFITKNIGVSRRIIGLVVKHSLHAPRVAGSTPSSPLKLLTAKGARVIAMDLNSVARGASVVTMDIRAVARGARPFAMDLKSVDRGAKVVAIDLKARERKVGC